jgi:hypothetical protein
MDVDETRRDQPTPRIDGARAGRAQPRADRRHTAVGDLNVAIVDPAGRTEHGAAAQDEIVRHRVRSLRRAAAPRSRWP